MDTSRRFRIVALFSTAAVVIAIAIAAYGGDPRLDAATTRPSTAVAPMSDRWYVETRNRPTQHDSWYIEAAPAVSPALAQAVWQARAEEAVEHAVQAHQAAIATSQTQRDRWYLEAKAQTSARDRWYLDMPGAREHSILTSYGQADRP
ncbi:MAG: hypothetical protein U0768_13975 [Anaerolineae bacterium]